MVHVDLAVDRADFPPLKHEFAPPGKRRFLYVGNSSWTKNVVYLAEIARRLPPKSIAWMGRGDSIPGVEELGWQDFARLKARALVAGYDFMLTVGRADSNPASVLEAMAWGLLPVCTRESGYVDYEGIINIPLDDARQAVEILRELQALPEGHLRAFQQANWAALDEHFNWRRLGDQVLAAVESDASPDPLPESLRHALRLQAAALLSPYSMLRTPALRLAARSISRLLSSS